MTVCVAARAAHRARPFLARELLALLDERPQALMDEFLRLSVSLHASYAQLPVQNVAQLLGVLMPDWPQQDLRCAAHLLTCHASSAASSMGCASGDEGYIYAELAAAIIAAADTEAAVAEGALPIVAVVALQRLAGLLCSESGYEAACSLARQHELIPHAQG